jgi:hypothetical protein
MTQTTAITEIIPTLADVKSRFNITRTESEGFFPEWYADLPEITEVDKAALHLIRRRYSGSQKSEVCPMPYAHGGLCPMPTEAYAQSYLI